MDNVQNTRKLGALIPKWGVFFKLHPSYSGIYVEDGMEGLKEPQMVNDSKTKQTKTVSYRHSRTDVHMTSQRLW